jgi:hypothetical protein
MITRRGDGYRGIYHRARICATQSACASIAVCEVDRFRGRLNPSYGPARNGEFVEPDQADLPCPVASSKIFPFSLHPNQGHNARRLTPLEGRIAIVTDAGWDAVDAGGAADESADLRTAKSCGPDASTPASSS